MEQNIPYFLQLSRREQKAALEAIIFSAEEAVSLPVLYKILISPEGFMPPVENIPVKTIEETPAAEITAGEEQQPVYADEIKLEENNKNDIPLSYFSELVDEINIELVETGRPFQIVNVAGGYQFATRSEYGLLIQQLIKAKSRKRLSQAALETLAIIAYRQPISKPEIEQIRGVNSNEIVNSLLEKNLVEIAGRKEGLGKSLLYGTTTGFLRMFGLYSLEDLPRLRELEEFMDLEDATGETIEITVPENLSHDFKALQEGMETNLISSAEVEDMENNEG